jgi:cell division protein FtsB
MGETLEFLKHLNWVLKPIAEIVVFLFTTKIGILIFFLGLIGVFVMSVYNQLRVRQLAIAASKSSSDVSVPFPEKIYIIGRTISKMFVKIVSNLPVFLAVFIFLLMVVGLSRGIEGLNTYIENQKKIKELTSILKQLDQRYKVAEIHVDEYNSASNETKISISFFDYAKQGFINEKQRILLKGNDIYFDAIVLNFEYSEISSGTNKNIVLPYRVFSELIPQEHGVPLTIKDENGIPLIFKRDSTDIYGMTGETYDKRLKEIMEYITNPEKARLAGIRSVYGNAVHKKVKTDDILTIWVEQTGGLVIKEVKDF